MGGGPSIPEELLAQLHPLEVKVLPHLKDGISLSTLAKKAGMQEVEAMRACQWLENKKAVKLTPLIKRKILLDTNAKKALKEGMPEVRFLRAVKQGAKTTQDIAKKARLNPQEVGVSIGLLKKRKLIILTKDKKITLTKEGKVAEPKSPEVLFFQRVAKQQPKELNKNEEKLISTLKARKAYLIIKERRDRKIALTELGKRLSNVNIKKFTFSDRLTSDDLKTNAWKKKKYRAYDVSINVPRISAGKLHFVQEAINYVRRIWVEMGFTEHGGTLTQSAFWDLDALFVPQDHPARELQDTFYLAAPHHRRAVDKQAFERVRDAHENGGTTNSKGWQYTYSRNEAEKLMLLTHDTVFSAHTLWAIREGKAQIPGKYFAISKVFRNEKIDWKHLFEFHQVGGIVVDKNVNFAQLLGYLRIFFAKMGFPKIRARPSHFPYTEPSVEIDVWNPRKKQWVELGGAGVFRPELTKPLIGEEIPVLAWGLGLERIIVEYFGLTDLRDLYRNDIKQLQEMKRFIKINEANDG